MAQGITRIYGECIVTVIQFFGTVLNRQTSSDIPRAVTKVLYPLISLPEPISEFLVSHSPAHACSLDSALDDEPVGSGDGPR